MQERVVVAVIGAGYMGRLHAEKYAKMPNVKLAGICDIDYEKGEKLSKDLNCSFYPDYRALPLAEINAVSIASDTSTHGKIGQFFLDNRIDILVEKPIASSYKEGLELIESANKHSRILQVGHLERFNPVFLKLKSCITTPRYFEIKRIAPFRGRGVDVDVVLDLMIHDIDLLLDLVGEKVKKVDAIGIPVLTESIDLAQVRIEFENGVVANVSTSRVAAGTERTMRIFQPNEYISVDLMKRHFKRLKKVDRSEALVPIEMEEESFGQSDPLYDQLVSFVASVKNRTGVVVTGREAVNAILVVEEIKKSINASIEQFNTSQLELTRAAG